MSSPGHALVVCTANICRSPMAAGLLSHALAAEPEPLRSLKVVSAGVAAGAGGLVTEHAVTALKKVGIDISGSVSRPLTQELLDGALVVFCMTENHREMIRMSAEPPPKHLLLFREFMTGDREIVDPYGYPLSHYEASRDEMVEAVPGIIDFLKAELTRR